MSGKKPNTEVVNLKVSLSNEVLRDLYNLEWNRRMSLFYGILNEVDKIPNKIFFGDIDGTVLYSKLKEEFPESYFHHNEFFPSGKIDSEQRAFFCIVRKDLIIHFEQSHEYNDRAIIIHSINLDIQEIEFLKSLIIASSKIERNKQYFYLLTNPSYGLEFKKVEISPCTIDLNSHYNDDFMEFDDYIKQSVKSERRAGKIVLMNGLFGTGKTFYIRHLISSLKLEFIYLTPSMASHLDKPELTELLVQNEGDKAIVIEDAEQLISKRNENNGSIASSILNLSDGIIGDSLKIKLIIITCNSKLPEIDPAILRKGRLLVNYEFQKLKQEKAQKLSDALGFSNLILEDTSLADIYNQDMKSVTARAETIGFRN